MPSAYISNIALSDAERHRAEGEITMQELEYSLFKKMKGSSAPGIDGFTVNWLRKFWSSLILVTFNAINECYREGSLTSNLRTGIIRLLRKGQKDPTLTEITVQYPFFPYIISLPHVALHNDSGR